MNPIAAILDEIFNLGPGAESIICQALEERKALNGMVIDVTNEIKENRFSRASAVRIAKVNLYADTANIMENRDIDVMDVTVPLRILQTHLVITVKSL